MRNKTKIIEARATAANEVLPEDYCLARELTLAGSHDEATRIYCRLLAETTSHGLQALIYNDLAALAATTGNTQAGHDLLNRALEIDAKCAAALENLSTLGFDCPAIPTWNRTSKPAVSGTSNLPIYGFMHVGILNHWYDILEEQLLKLHASGLWNRTERIFVGLVGPQHEEFDFDGEKLEVLYRNKDFQEAEYPTLKAVQEFCRTHECLVYYMHTKGNFHVSENTRDWRHLMEHFVIQRHEDCIRSLMDHDACGVNLLTEQQSQVFFAGNFWWARSAYIRTLPPLSSLAPNGRRSQPDRYTCERWIGMNRSGRLKTLHQCPVDQYHSRYARSNYARVAEVPPCPALDAPSGWRGLENRFQDLLEPVDPIQTIVDIGVEFGHSLFSFAMALPRATVVGIDPYRDEAVGIDHDGACQLKPPGQLGCAEAEAWLRRFIGEFPRVILLRGCSAEIAPRWTSQVDVIHIGCAHSYEDVSREFGFWEPKLRPGGCVLLHNTCLFDDTVGRFFHELPGRKAEIRDCYGLGAWYKQ